MNREWPLEVEKDALIILDNYSITEKRENILDLMYWSFLKGKVIALEKISKDIKY